MGIALELDVSNGTREGQVAVHSAKFDESSCCDDASILVFVAGLVVERKGLCFTFETKDTPRVSGIGDDDLTCGLLLFRILWCRSGYEKGSDSSAPRRIGDSLLEKVVVCGQKSILECLLIAAVLVLLSRCESSVKYLCGIFCCFRACELGKRKRHCEWNESLRKALLL